MGDSHNTNWRIGCWYCSSSVPTLVGLQAEDVVRKPVGLVGCDDKIRHVLVARFQKHL